MSKVLIDNDEEGDDGARWYPCACGAEHNTPTCPFGGHDVPRQLAALKDTWLPTDQPTVDDGIGIPDVQAVNRLRYAPCTCGVLTGGARDPHDNCPVHASDELARLRAVNQELVTALSSLATIWSESAAYERHTMGNSQYANALDQCATDLDRALQHAETRTP